MPPFGWKPSPETVAKVRATKAAKLLSPAERFSRHWEPDLNGGCWLWSGTLIASTGYGQIEISGKGISSHRLSYELHHGPIPAGLLVCHKCDVRACVNPAHLFAGTHSDNAMDMFSKGRGNTPVGEQHPGAKITAGDVPTILQRLDAGEACAVIGRDYGVTDCAINAIRRGASWTHVTGFAKTQRRRRHLSSGAEDGAAQQAAPRAA